MFLDNLQYFWIISFIDESMASLLVTGTDTEVGKTILIISLAAYYQKYYPDSTLGLFKLLQTGIGDREIYTQLFGNLDNLKIVTPLCLSTPVAPPVAAAKEGVNIDLDKIRQELNNLTQEQHFVLVEALGGLGSPVTAELTVADIAGDWGLETILVVPVKLGAISQTVANVALARQTKVNLKGIVLNCREPLDEEEINTLAPIDLIESLTQTKILGTMPYLENYQDLEQLAKNISDLKLEKLLANSAEDLPRVR